MRPWDANHPEASEDLELRHRDDEPGAPLTGVRELCRDPRRRFQGRITM